MSTSTFPTTALALLALVALASAPLACANPPPDGLLSPSWQSPTSFPQEPGLFTTSLNLDSNPPNANADFATAVAIQSDGKVVVGGYAWNFEPDGGHDQYGCVVQRYNVDGSLDTSFGNQGQFRFNRPAGPGPGIECYVNSINIGFDQKIFASGTLMFATPTPMQFVLNTDGTIDTTFGVQWGTHEGTIAQTVQLDGGGQGVFSVGSGRYSSDATYASFYYVVGAVEGPQDSGFFGPYFGTGDDTGKAGVIEWDGGTTKELYIVGTANHPAQGNNPAYDSCQVVALKSVNSAPFALDDAFNDSGILVFDDPVPRFHEQVSSECNAAVARPATGSAWNTGIIVGGERSDVGGTTQSVYLLVEVGADGTLTFHDAVTGASTDPYFEEEGVGVRNAINSMTVQADGKLLLAGRAGTTVPYHGPADMGLMRLNADFSKDTSFSPIPLSLDNTTGANPSEDEYATAVALDPARARAIVVGSRSYDIIFHPSDYDWMLGGVKDVADRIFGDTFDGPPVWP